MTIACLDEWVLEWRGLRKTESNGEALRNE